MASIKKRSTTDGRISYQVRVRLKGQPTCTATFERLTDARRWAQKTEADIREGRHFSKRESERHTLGDLIDRYTARVVPTKRANTQLSQQRQYVWWKEQLGVFRLCDVTPSKITECRERLADTGLAPATVNRYLAALSHAFTYAVRDLEWVDANPFQKVTKSKEPRGRLRFLSDDERTRLLQACRESKNPLLYPGVMLALCTGMRREEQMSLRWSQVDLTSGRIQLEHTKNNERRTVVATGPALQLLQRLSVVRRIDNDHVFPGRVKGAPMALRASFLKALKSAEIEDFRWHDLRHSFASELAMSGASLAELAEAMGHKTLSMVKRYAHLTEGHISKVVERMTARVFQEDMVKPEHYPQS